MKPNSAVGECVRRKGKRREEGCCKFQFTFITALKSCRRRPLVCTTWSVSMCDMHEHEGGWSSIGLESISVVHILMRQPPPQLSIMPLHFIGNNVSISNINFFSSPLPCFCHSSVTVIHQLGADR